MPVHTPLPKMKEKHCIALKKIENSVKMITVYFLVIFSNKFVQYVDYALCRECYSMLYVEKLAVSAGKSLPAKQLIFQKLLGRFSEFLSHYVCRIKNCQHKNQDKK